MFSMFQNIRLLVVFVIAGGILIHYATRSWEQAAQVINISAAVLGVFWFVTWLAFPKKAPPPDPDLQPPK